MRRRVRDRLLFVSGALSFGAVLSCAVLTGLDDYGNCPTERCNPSQPDVDVGGEDGTKSDAGENNGDALTTGDVVAIDDADAALADDVITWCTTQSPKPFFCDDFDRTPIGFGLWTGPVVTNNNKVGVNNAYFTSAPNALLVTTQPAAAGACQHATLSKTFTSSFLRADIGFDVRSNNAVPSGLVTTFFVGVAPDTFQVDLSLGLNSYIQQDFDGGVYFDPFPGPGFNPDGGFAHVDVTITRAGYMGATDGEISVSVDGQLKKTVKARSNLFTQTHELHIGDYCVINTATSWRLHYDNVTLRLTP